MPVSSHEPLKQPARDGLMSETHSKLTTIFLTDDQIVMRQAIRLMIETNGAFEVVGEAGNAEDTLRGVWKLKPNVLLLDIKMPGINGIDIISRVRLLSQKTAVLVFSMYDNVAYIKAAFRAGASGYLLKTAEKSALFAALKEVSVGGFYMQDEVVSPMLRHITLEAAIRNKEAKGTLALRELQVVQLLADGAHNREIAEKLSISEETVKTYLKRVYEKLGAQDRAHAVSIALRQGLIG
jgi:DNA-binding NarL/FixJ family response regulator